MFSSIMRIEIFFKVALIISTRDAALAITKNEYDSEATAALTVPWQIERDVTGRIMRFLPLEDRISILHFPGGVYHFNRLAPEAFIQKFNIYSVKKLKEYNLNDQFISKVFELLGNDLLSFIINFSAYSHKWATVKFMLVKGVSPLLLVYSVRRAATHQLTEDLGKLRYLLNSTKCAFDFERFSVSKPDITHLKRFLAEHKLGLNYHISAFDSRRIDLMLEDACANPNRGKNARTAMLVKGQSVILISAAKKIRRFRSHRGIENQEKNSRQR
jgi:hypothetical protein